MLSLEKCRKLLGGNKAIEDKQLEIIRDRMYCLADIVLETYSRHKRKEHKVRPRFSVKTFGRPKIPVGIPKNSSSYSKGWQLNGGDPE